MLQRGYCCNHLDTLLSLYENDLMSIIYQISTKNFKIINDGFIFVTIFFSKNDCGIWVVFICIELIYVTFHD